MISNYFRVAVRNLLRNKGFSFINIFGLTIGLATCLLILVYVIDELSYDRQNKEAHRIYRIDGDISIGGNHTRSATSPGPMGPVLKQDLPEVEQVTRFRNYGGFLVRKGNQDMRENKVIYADSGLFKVFTLPIIEGDPSTALTEPNSVVITESTAKRYFDRTDVVGQTLLINNNDNFRITGVIRDIPANTHFNYDFFVSLSGSEESRTPAEWLNNNFNTYVLLREGTDPTKLGPALEQEVNKYIGPLEGAVMHSSMEAFTRSGNHIRYSLMPLLDIHLYSDKVAELGPNGSIEYVYLFGAIALLILLIACVNFMNLSTAKSANRSREVGIRKVLGSLKAQLIFQFIAESVLMSFIAMVLALALAWLILPYFNQLAGKDISFRVFLSWPLLLSVTAMVLIVGFLAGSYPAFVLSAFKPIRVLKGDLSTGFRTGRLRNGLVVFQFGISILLIVGTTIIYLQLKYIRTKEIGFNREQVLIVHNASSLGTGANSFKEEMLRLSGVQAATATSFMPTSSHRNAESYFLSPSMDQSGVINLQSWPVDEQYIPMLGMQMVNGRNFSKAFPTDSQAVVINEAAARLIGYPDPVDHPLYEMPHKGITRSNIWHIIGVVRDFNFSSLRQQVTPLVLYLGQTPRQDMAFRIRNGNIATLLSSMEDKWRSLAPTLPFSYSFMDEDFNAIYKAEQKIGRISLCFAILAIIVACLGLFGLTAYAAEQRKREIGIRKVLGATIPGITMLICKDFLALVLIAALIAFPLSWWYMHHWLQGFAYRTPIGWPIFAFTGLLVLVIALLTVSFQSIRAALANPVNSLRSE